jgi:hypothetical protein
LPWSRRRRGQTPERPRPSTGKSRLVTDMRWVRRRYHRISVTPWYPRSLQVTARDAASRSHPMPVWSWCRWWSSGRSSMRRASLRSACPNGSLSLSARPALLHVKLRSARWSGLAVDVVARCCCWPGAPDEPARIVASSALADTGAGKRAAHSAHPVTASLCLPARMRSTVRRRAGNGRTDGGRNGRRRGLRSPASGPERPRPTPDSICFVPALLGLLAQPAGLEVRSLRGCSWASYARVRGASPAVSSDSRG